MTSRNTPARPLVLVFRDPVTGRLRARRLTGVLVVGRRLPPAEISIEAASVAERHAQIDATGTDAPVIRLLDPEAALFVNGTLCQRAVLRSGDRLCFGEEPASVGVSPLPLERRAAAPERATPE